MKKILFLILIISSFKLVAQHSDLESYKWYVESLTINTTTELFPVDLIEFPYTFINFLGFTTNLTISENETLNENCQIGFTSHVSYTSINIFEFTDFTPFIASTECSTSSIDFMNLYISFYEDYLTEQFTYSITTEVDNSKTLLIINNNGDEALYTNTFLNPPPQSISDNNWFLQNLIISNLDNSPPNNNEIADINLSINDGNGGFFTSVCSFVESIPYFDYDESNFYMYQMATDYGMTLCSPTYPENNSFTDLYINNFYLNSLPGPFSYEHTINESTETLTITNALGNQAVYINTPLSIEDYDDATFLIFPNPVIDKLTIIESIQGDVELISVYNMFGKEIYTYYKTKTLDLQELNSGIYLIKVRLKSKETVTRKIIKK